MTAATFDAQAPGIADRVKTCARAICAEEGGTWRSRRMAADRSAPGWAGIRKTPRAWVQARCQMTARPHRSIRWRLAKGGDDPFTLIWSRGSALLFHRIDASPSRAELNWR